MKKSIIFGSIQIIFTILLGLPQASFAASYPVGTLMRDPETKTVYYIAQNNKRYAFPNEETFRTWYPEGSASVHVTEKKRAITRIRSGQAQITVRPGNTLVAFGTDPKVYAVDTAAVLRWIQTEKDAVRIFGLNWQSKLVRLPANDTWNYTMGRTLDAQSTFARSVIARQAFVVDDELKARKLIVPEKKRTLASIFIAKTSSANPASLTSLKENLKNGLVPRFTSAHTSYELDAKYNETEMTLTPRAVHPDATITVNGAPLEEHTFVRLALNYGDNRFIIDVTAPEGQRLTYTLVVRRRNPSNDAFLTTINENITNSLSPEFDPDEYEYDLTARNTEESVRLTVDRSDKTALVSVNGVPLKNDRGGVTIPLPVGNTSVPIVVSAENGTTRTYTVHVHRSEFSQTEDRDLLSLKENLEGDLSPEFDPNFTRYYLHANADENRVLITAKPKNKHARVSINDDPVQKKSIILHDDETEIIVRVEATDTYFAEYKIIVDKDFE